MNMVQGLGSESLQHRRYIDKHFASGLSHKVPTSRLTICLSFLSSSIYCQTLFRVLSAGVLCTLRIAGWKPTSNHIEITVGFFNLRRGWLSLHRGHPVNVPIWRTMHLSSVIPANDIRESVFGHRNFHRLERGSNLGLLAPRQVPNHWATTLLSTSCLKNVSMNCSVYQLCQFPCNLGSGSFYLFYQALQFYSE